MPLLNCLFCQIPPERVIAENSVAYVIMDGFPVTEGHLLVIPKRHVEHYFLLAEKEVLGCHQLLVEMQQRLKQQDDTIEGFNIGMNCGEVAGQTIFHCHIHLIPRRKGDVDEPRGGVRHIIPGKGYY